MDKTITGDVRKRLNENGILKVFTSLTLTDTIVVVYNLMLYATKIQL